MKKTIFTVSLALVVLCVLVSAPAQSQPGRGGYGYGMGPGMMGGGVDVPTQLPAPANKDWVQKLREILTLENQSLTQYQADQETFNAYMPYMMVVPQEYDHITWIEQLFAAYDLPGDGKMKPVVENKTLTEAYELSVKMEADLLPRYEWLVKKAEDRDTAQVLNTILLQSRWHLTMFDHALRMGPGMMGGYGHGYGMGPGMMGGYGHGYGMGPGMMGGYGPGYGMGPGMMGGYGPGSGMGPGMMGGYGPGSGTGPGMMGGYGPGYGMGPGMMGGYGPGYGMGPGMMGGYGPGYGRQFPSTGRALSAKEAEAIMKKALKSWRNPNLKLGKIKDIGNAFEAEILTKKNEPVDMVLIDKFTGGIRSAY